MANVLILEHWKFEWNVAFASLSSKSNKTSFGDIYLDSLDHDPELFNKYIKEREIDLIIPTRYSDMMFLSEHRNQIRNVNIINSDAETTSIINNRYLLEEFLCSHDMSDLIPKTYTSFYKNRATYRSKIRFPCIFKSINKDNPDNKLVYSQLLQNQDQLNELIHPEPVIDYIIQEYISGPSEYTGHFSINEGIINYAVYHKISKSNHEIPQSNQVTITNYEHQDLFAKIFRIMNLSGVFYVHFKNCIKTYNTHIPIKILDIGSGFDESIIHNRKDFEKIMMYVVLNN